jgi:hypothetical protein
MFAAAQNGIYFQFGRGHIESKLRSSDRSDEVATGFVAYGITVTFVVLGIGISAKPLSRREL